MKRSERHHLKENELIVSLRRAGATIERHQRALTAVVLAVVLAVVAAAGFLLWRQHVESRANASLAEGMRILSAEVMPPTVEGEAAPPPYPGTYASERARLEAALPALMTAADSHRSAPSAIAARYHAAATLAALGRTDEAAEHYQLVVDRAGRENVYGQMARLGLANVQSALGRHDSAIAIFRELLQSRDAGVPVDAILVQMGRVHRAAGQEAEAQQAFRRIVEEFPQSPYAGLARRELDGLESGAAVALSPVPETAQAGR
jgi:tetratricopeptide (TPR) repeat protein